MTTRLHVFTFGLCLLFTVSVTISVQAGEQYTYQDLALAGYDPVAYFTKKEATKGQQRYSYTWNNAQWLFANARHRRIFMRNPEKYAPAYDGHCAYGVAKKGKVPGHPLAWTIYNDRLYVNINKKIQALWERSIPDHLRQSEKNWERLEARPASKRALKDI